MSLSIDLGLPDLTDVQEIGRGGFGIVYRAQQKSVGRTVAVKMLATVSLGEETRRRFERECKAMAAVSSHPNIIALYDSGMTATGRPYIVMEYATGGALASRLPLSWERAVEVGVKTAGALETAHQIGIFHRDVKPENILLSAYEEPKLTDFGVAKVAESSETPSGNITASILHAAPETLSGSRPSATTDVYSLASTIFALIVGRAPFAGENEETLAPLLTRIMLADVPDLRQYDVPDAVCAVLEQALAKEPAERQQTPAEFGRMLAAAQQACGVPPTEMLIAGVERAATPAASANGKDDRATQRRNRDSLVAALPQIPSQEPREPTPAKSTPRQSSDAQPGAGSTSSARRKLLVGGVVAAVAVAGGVIATASSGGSDKHPSSPSVQTPVDLSASYVFADAHRGALTAKRSWKLDSTGGAVSSTTSVRNDSAKPLRLTDIEVIPKSIASNVGSVTFSRQPTHIIQSDPVVSFDLVVRPHATMQLDWQVKLTKTAQPELLAQSARTKKAAEAKLLKRLPRLAKRWDFKAAQVVPFATAADPGLKNVHKPSSKPSGGTPSANTSSTPASGNGSTTPATVTTSTAATNQAPTLAAIGGRSSNELDSVSLTLSGHDPEGAALTYNRVSGSLPPGVSLNSRTGVISGRIPYNALNKTTSWQSIASLTYSAKFVVSDGHKQSAAQTLTWTVRDTYTTMPNYIHKYGCGYGCGEGMVSIGNLLTPANRDFRCHIGTAAQDPNWDGSGQQVYSQSVGAGSAIKWGGSSPVRIYYYYQSTSSCSA